MNLMRFFDDWIQRPWVWGESDCCQFVAAYVEFVTGRKPGADLEYCSEEEAQALIDQHDGLCGLVTHFLGEPQEQGRHGMVALVDRPQLLGVVYRDRIVARTRTDINDIPMSRARRFWSCQN